MSDYISREAALTVMERLRDKCGNDEMAFALNWASGLLRNVPTADVVEVRHESWKDIGIMWIDKTNRPDGISIMFCPACERYATRIYNYGNPTDMMNFCPACGAKMDGGQDDV